jgi:hypothetical protein
MPTHPGYDIDLALWSQAQVAALRAGRWSELDVENLVEEIEALTRRDKREIRSRLTVLIMHLLKLQYQPERATRSWRSTIDAQVTEVELVLEDSPSLRGELPEFIRRAYRDARRKASSETGIPIATFPETPTPEILRAIETELAGENVSDG